MLTKNQLISDLRKMGVSQGDTLYLRASLSSLGKVEGDLYDVVVNGLKDAVGPQGTIIVPAFNKIQNIFETEKNVISEITIPISGAVSKLFLKHSDAYRSRHPSHSFVAVGPNAEQLLAGHDESTSCFFPIKKLAEMDGKMLLLGCVNDSPGFSTVHVAQFELGLTQKHYVRYLQRCWIKRGSEIVKWRPAESPGCSLSFGKFYLSYIEDENFVAGKVGNAYGILIPSARAALDSELSILKNRATFVDCGRADCLTCGLRGYQMWRIPITILSLIVKRIFFKRKGH